MEELGLIPAWLSPGPSQCKNSYTNNCLHNDAHNKKTMNAAATLSCPTTGVWLKMLTVSLTHSNAVSYQRFKWRWLSHGWVIFQYSSTMSWACEHWISWSRQKVSKQRKHPMFTTFQTIPISFQKSFDSMKITSLTLILLRTKVYNQSRQDVLGM